MVQHNEDSGKFEMKISSDGILFAYCPNSKKLWATQLQAVPTTETVTANLAIRPKIPAGGSRIGVRSGAMAMMKTAAKKEYPALFIK